MTYQQIIERIPAEYRKEILELNMISKAQAQGADPSMAYLGTVWKEYVSPDEDLGCGLCLSRILDNFRQLQPTMVAMEKQSKLLDTL